MDKFEGTLRAHISVNEREPECDGGISNKEGRGQEIDRLYTRRGRIKRTTGIISDVVKCALSDKNKKMRLSCTKFMERL
jgi:hypothetical protein